jgi:energy-coupling factor transporter transmembrane protein EcfT
MDTLILFRYYQGDSLLHRIDARVKLLCIIITGAAILNTGAVGMSILTIVACVSLLRISGTVKNVFAQVKPLLVFLLIVFILSSLLYRGHSNPSPVPPLTEPWLYTTEAPAPSLPIFSGAWTQSVSYAALLTTRLLLFFLCGLLLTGSTTISALRDGIVSLLEPLPFVPAHSIGFMISLTIGLLPTLHEQVVRVQEARVARGMSGWGNPMRTLPTLLVPVMVLTFRRTEEIADAMQARCYSVHRTVAKRQLAKGDLLFLTGTAVLAVLVVWWVPEL